MAYGTLSCLFSLFSMYLDMHISLKIICISIFNFHKWYKFHSLLSMLFSNLVHYSCFVSSISYTCHNLPTHFSSERHLYSFQVLTTVIILWWIFYTYLIMDLCRNYSAVYFWKTGSSGLILSFAKYCWIIHQNGCTI